MQLTAVDERIKATVACVPPSLNWEWKVAAHHFAPHIKETPILILMGNRDPFTSVAQTKKLLSLVSAPDKGLKFYDSGHKLPESSIEDALAWFAKNLK